MLLHQVQRTLQLDLIVRNDVKNVPTLAETNGKYANRHVFMDNWKRKTTNQYDTEGFMYILQAVGVAEGTPINSIRENFINLIANKPVSVYVKRSGRYRTRQIRKIQSTVTVSHHGISALLNSKK